MKMNKYVKEYLLRGALFGGLGPIVLGVVYAILSLTIDGFSLGGVEVLLAILSTYAIAFVQAGSTVFNQIEGWPMLKSIACHFSSLYAVYVLAYLVNTWIPFEWVVILVFSGIFVAVFAITWLIVYLSLRATGRRLTARL
ncbi:MAG: DUF3021 domain-containing protein [Clostridia bacterium]|nr:DUF3021 domain-containing protein [Clostridia bacterium]